MTINHKEIVSKFAKSNGLKFEEIDRDTFRLCGKFGLLQIFFRENQYEFSCWGAFVEDVDEDCFDFEQTLLNVTTNYKMIYGLDKDKEILCQNILAISESIEDIVVRQKGVKYILEVGFFDKPQFYTYKGRVIENIEMPPLFNPLTELDNLLKGSLKISQYIAFSNELNCSPSIKIELDNGDTGYISSNIWGTQIYLYFEKVTLRDSFSTNEFTLSQIANNIVITIKKYEGG